MIGLSISSFYYKPAQSREEREQQQAELRAQIEAVQKDFPRSGYRRVQRYLHRQGIRVGERRLRGVMEKYGLWADIKKAWVKTTDSNHSHRVYPNLLPERLVDGPNQVWTADITYIRIANGFVYLAVILDLFFRKVIGFSISKRIDGQLALNALRMAIRSRKSSSGVIHHSDRGVQYLYKKYVRLLTRLGFHLSNSAKGNPYDNAWTESFMKTIKQEEVYLASYETYLDVVENLPRFIDDVYNEKRIHSSIGYLTPNELEAKIKTQPEMAGQFSFTL